MNSVRRVSDFALLFAILIGPYLAAEETPRPLVLKPAELRPEHDGKEVTMTLKIADTQLIGGQRDGEYPHVLLHQVDRFAVPSLQVMAKGDVADALHRYGCVAPDDRFVGRTIRATGKLKVYKDFPKGEDQRPVYVWELREWNRFEIVRPESEK